MSEEESQDTEKLDDTGTDLDEVDVDSGLTKAVKKDGPIDGSDLGEDSGASEESAGGASDSTVTGTGDPT
jgi:hypothetical protein